jgi:osmotically-inducible protein OsmY
MKNRSGSYFFVVAMAVTLLVYGCNKPEQVTPTSPVSSTAVGNVSDIDITEHVKTALQQNDGLKGFNIQVVTLKGDVRLIGLLDSQTQIDEAIRIALASDGAHTVHNELKIKM